MFDYQKAVLSPEGFELNEYFEGWETKERDENGAPTGYYIAYKHPGDPWTVGPGLTGRFRVSGKVIQQGTRVSYDECVEEMQLRLHNEVYPLVRKHFRPKNQHEFDALVCWTWNLDQGKLDAGRYTLPSLVVDVKRLTDPDARAALIRKWVEYKNPKTIFEQGLYRRRLAELCMFFGLPWTVAVSAVLIRDKKNPDIIKTMTDPFHILDLAEAAAEAAKPIPQEPDPPKAPAPVIEVKAEPLPEIDPSLPPKAMETSKTHKGLSKAESGKETAIVGGVLTGIGAMLPNIQAITAYLNQFDGATILTALSVVGLGVVGVGAWRWWMGRMIAHEGRVTATQAKV